VRLGLTREAFSICSLNVDWARKVAPAAPGETADGLDEEKLSPVAARPSGLTSTVNGKLEKEFTIL
jgi:hypothetical protein